eukprot:tig00021525_g22118.t1
MQRSTSGNEPLAHTGSLMKASSGPHAFGAADGGLPIELWEKIVSYLDSADAVVVSAVCTYFRGVVLRDAPPFVGGGMLAAELDAYATDACSKILCVTGDSGCGKSSLLAHWAGRWRARGPADAVVVHLSGGATETAQASSLVRRAYGALRTALPWSPELEIKGGDPRAHLCQFAAWLGRVRSGLDEKGEGAMKVVLVLDALDQLALETSTGGAAPLMIIPPGGASAKLRIIISSDKGPTLDAAMQLQSGARLLPVLGLSKSERRAIVRHQLPEAGDALASAIAGLEQSGNALWLSVLLAYLRSGPGAPDESTLAAAAGRGSAESLYGLLMERWGATFGAGAVRAALSALVLSRQGMSEEELASFLSGEAPAPALASLLRAGVAAGALADRGGLVALRHTAARLARCAALGRWWAAQPPSERRAREGPHAFERAGDYDGLVTLLWDLDVLLRLRSPETNDAELLRLWVASGRQASAAEGYARAVEREEAAGRGGPARVARALRDAGAVVRQLGFDEQALPLLRRAIEIQKGLPGPQEEALAWIYREIANALEGVDDLAEAEQYYRLALEARRVALGADHIDTADAMNNLGTALHRPGVSTDKEVQEGRYAEAEGLFHAAIAVLERVRPPRPAPPPPPPHLLLSGLHLSSLLLSDLYSLIWQHLGPNHPKTATVYANLGFLFDSRNAPETAVGYTERAMAAMEAAHGPDCLEVGIASNNLATTYAALGRLAEGLAAARRAEPIFRRFFGETHINAAYVLCQMGRLLLQVDPPRPEEAAARLAEAVAIQKGAASFSRLRKGQYHFDTGNGVCQQAQALAHAGRRHEADRLLIDYLQAAAVRPARPARPAPPQGPARPRPHPAPRPPCAAALPSPSPPSIASRLERPLAPPAPPPPLPPHPRTGPPLPTPPPPPPPSSPRTQTSEEKATANFTFGRFLYEIGEADHAHLYAVEALRLRRALGTAGMAMQQARPQPPRPAPPLACL